MLWILTTLLAAEMGLKSDIKYDLILVFADTLVNHWAHMCLSIMYILYTSACASVYMINIVLSVTIRLNYTITCVTYMLYILSTVQLVLKTWWKTPIK